MNGGVGGAACEGSGAEIERVKLNVVLKALRLPFYSPGNLHTCRLVSEAIDALSAKKSSRFQEYKKCVDFFVLCVVLGDFIKTEK